VGRRSGAIVAAVTAATMIAAMTASMASAAELVTAEVTNSTNDVTVTQGTSTTSTIALSATGAIDCTVTSGSPSTAKVDTSYALDGTGALTASSLSSAFNFFSDGNPNGSSGNCGTTWTGAPTPYSVSATFSAAATTAVGPYSVVLVSSETNPSASGKLGDTTATTVTVHVVAPVATNHAPTVKTAAADANGNEGDTLSTSGAFQDADGDTTLSLSVPNGTPGSFTDNGSGTWSWSLLTTNDTHGTVVVTASDGHGGTVTDSFNYAAVNVAPTDPGVPTLSALSTTPNNTGLFTVAWTASSDVAAPADAVTYTLQHENANSTWSDVASGLTGASYTFTGSGSEPEGTWLYRVQATDGEASNGTSGWATDASAIVVVDETAPNAPTLTPPAADYTDTSLNLWYKSAPSVSVTDNGDPALADTSDGSGVDPLSFTSLITASTEGENDLTATVADYAGNVSTPGTQTVFVDTTGPTVALPCPTSLVILNSTLSASWTASDGTGSGVATGYGSGSITVPTGTVGAHQLYVPAGASTDNVGNVSPASNTCSYRVAYNWSGFLQPINDTAHFVGETTSIFKAGSTVPVKFQLTDANGAAVQQASPGPVWLTPQPGGLLPSTATVDETTYSTTDTPGGYYRWDATGLQYIYNWNTSKSMGGKYWRIGVKLDDGSTYYVSIGLK